MIIAHIEWIIGWRKYDL